MELPHCTSKSHLKGYLSIPTALLFFSYNIHSHATELIQSDTREASKWSGVISYLDAPDEPVDYDILESNCKITKMSINFYDEQFEARELTHSEKILSFIFSTGTVNFSCKLSMKHAHQFEGHCYPTTGKKNKSTAIKLSMEKISRIQVPQENADETDLNTSSDSRER